MRGDRIAWLRTNFSRGNAFLAHAPFYYGVTNTSKRSLERVTIFGLDGKLPVQVFVQHSISPVAHMTNT